MRGASIPSCQSGLLAAGRRARGPRTWRPAGTLRRTNVPLPTAARHVAELRQPAVHAHGREVVDATRPPRARASPAACSPGASSPPSMRLAMWSTSCCVIESRHRAPGPTRRKCVTLTSWCWIVQWSYTFVKGGLDVVHDGKIDGALRTAGRRAHTSPSAATSHAVVIRPAGDADLPLLHDLAELDSATPLRGPALVAVVDGVVWAACSIDDGPHHRRPLLPERRGGEPAAAARAAAPRGGGAGAAAARLAAAPARGSRRRVLTRRTVAAPASRVRRARLGGGEPSRSSHRPGARRALARPVRAGRLPRPFGRGVLLETRTERSFFTRRLAQLRRSMCFHNPKPSPAPPCGLGAGDPR